METNSKYPFFQKGAVLKSSDLNQIIDSFTLDDNGIRQLIGHGILEGLEIEFDSETKELTIKKGCAVAPNGELLILKEDRNLDYKTLEHKTGCLYIFKIPDKEVIENPKAIDENCGCDTNINPFNSLREIEVDFGTDESKICENLEICIPRWCSYCLENEKIIKGLKESISNVANGYMKTANCFPTCFIQQEFSLENVLNAILNSIIPTDNLNNFNTIDICKAQYIYDYLKDLIAAQEEFLQYANHIRRTENPEWVYLGTIETETETNKCLRTPCREIFCHFENEKKAKFYACRMMKLADAEVFGFPDLEKISNIKSQNEQFVETVKIENGNEKKPIRITPSAALSRPLSERAIPFYLKEDIRPYWNYELTASHQQDSIPYFEDVQGNHLICDLAKYDFFRIEGYCGMDLEEVVIKIVDVRSKLNIAFDIRIVVFNEKESYGIYTYYEDLQRQYAILRHQYLCQWEPKPGAPNQILPIIPLLLAKYNNQVTDCPSLAFELLKSDFNTRREDLIFDHYKQKHTGLEHFAGVPNGGTLVLCVISNGRLTKKVNDSNDAVNQQTVVDNKYIVVGDLALPYRCCDSDGVIECLLEEELEVEIKSINDKSIEAKISKGKTIYSEWRDSDGKPIKVNSPQIALEHEPNSFAAMSYCYEISTFVIDDPILSFNARGNQKKLSHIEEFDRIKAKHTWTRFKEVVDKFEQALLSNDINILKKLDNELKERDNVITKNAKLYELFQPVKTSLLGKFKKKDDIDFINNIDARLKL